MLIYTLVITYNGEQCISKCLQSLRDSTIQSHVLVIDNASSDNTVDLIRAKYPEVRLILQTENLGFGAANNIGLKLALEEGVDYVFLLNQDAFVNENCIEQLICLAKLNPEYGIISPMQYYKREKLDCNFHLYLDEGISKYGKNEIIQSVDFVNAAVWLLPSRMLRLAGGFSPLYHHYGEDVNFCDRVLFYKYKVGIAIQSIAYHERTQQISMKKRYFTFLLDRFKLKSLIYLANPNNSNFESLVKLWKEIVQTPVSGKIKCTVYRLLIFKIVTIYISMNWKRISYLKIQSLKEAAFLQT